MKSDILALIVGLASGIAAYYTISLIPIKHILMPGFVFGAMSAPFVWYYLRSITKTTIWVVLAGVSYNAAFWSVVFVPSGMPFDNVVQEIVRYAITGFAGALVLVVSYRIFIEALPTRWIVGILTAGALIPGALIPLFGVSVGWFAGPKDSYLLVTMILWQGFMLFAFAHLLRERYEINNSINH